MANAAYAGEKGKDANWQLKTGGVMTDVQSSSMSGTRTSAFGYGIFGNEKSSQKFARPAVTGQFTFPLCPLLLPALRACDLSTVLHTCQYRYLSSRSGASARTTGRSVSGKVAAQRRA
jgi:hypothetical protein